MYMDAILFLLTIILIFLVILYHRRLQYKEREKAAFQSVWWPLLEQSMDKVPERLPKLKAMDVTNFFTNLEQYAG